MHIIETKTAPNPRRVRIFLAEKGIAVPMQDRQLDTLTEDAFTAINPSRQVPVLILDDGTAISETVAICRYFEEVQPEPPLMGQGAVGRAVCEMWQRRIELGAFAHIAHAFRHKHPSMVVMEAPQIAAWGDANKDKAIAALSRLEPHLAQHRYLTGDTFSIADITLLVAMDFMKPARIPRPEGLPNLDRWYREVAARPSASA